MDRMINYIWLAWKLAYKLRTYRACNSNIRFSKYEFNNKLLGGAVVSKIGFKLYQTQPTNKNILVLVFNIEFNNKLLGGIIVPKIGFKLHFV